MTDTSDADVRWCVLRTSAAQTLTLAKTLAATGIEAWTPIAMLVRRTPRKRERVERPAPIMPTFVFIRADRVGKALFERSRPGSDHPPFSVFQHGGRIPEIADRELVSLRNAEANSQLAAKRSRPAPFEIGQRVQPTEGPFAGLSGVVEERVGKFALVCFDGAFKIKIEGWQLPRVVAQAA